MNDFSGWKRLSMLGIGKLSVLLFAIWIAGTSLYAIVETDSQSGIFRRLLSVIPWAGYAHIIGGSIALVLGGLQFSSRLRRRNLELHKLMGKAYVVCVLVSTLGAFVSLSFTQSPWPAKSAFWLLATLWPIATLAGYPRGEKFDFHWHGRLMILSYSMTCVAISLRLLLGLLLVSEVDFRIAYPISAWGGLVGNLIIAFLLIGVISKVKSKAFVTNGPLG
ncbi:MAG: DUF2306 domain-containing protein [Mariniblastus sp.]